MKTFILILLFIGNGKGGVTTAEFANEASCKAALTKAEKLTDGYAYEKVVGICVPTWEPGTK